MDLQQKLDLIELPLDLVEYSKQCIITQFATLQVLIIIYEWLPAINNKDKPCINPTNSDVTKLHKKILEHCQCSKKLCTILNRMYNKRNLISHPSKKSLQNFKKLGMTTSVSFKLLNESLRIAGKEAKPKRSSAAIDLQIENLAAKFKNPLEVFSKFSNEAIQLPGPSLRNEAEMLNSFNSPLIDAVPLEKKGCLEMMKKCAISEESYEDEMDVENVAKQLCSN